MYDMEPSLREYLRANSIEYRALQQISAEAGVEVARRIGMNPDALAVLEEQNADGAFVYYKVTSAESTSEDTYYVVGKRADAYGWVVPLASAEYSREIGLHVPGDRVPGDEPSLYRYAVDEPFPGDLPPTDGIWFNFLASGARLTISLSDPSQAEVDNVREAPVLFAVAHVDGITWLLAKFGALNWLDASYDYWLNPPDERPTFGALASSDRLLLTVLLVDRRTHILRVIRAISLDPEMTQMLREAIARQVAAGPIADFDSRIASIQRRYSTDDLVRIAGLTSLGGT